jgi:hypothetical protein
MILGLLIDLVDVLRSIDARLTNLETQGTKAMSALDDLTAQVAANTSAEQSAITLIQGLSAQLSAASTDPAKIQALASQLNTSAAALSAAILANTPAAPSP